MPSMNLTSIGNPPHETIRGVRFAMLGGFELLTVLVTHTALDEIEAQRPENAGYLDRFDRYRDRFEQIASSKHGRGQVEISGVVIIHAGDLA